MRLKFSLVGHEGVGKSCLMHRFANDTFSEAYLPRKSADFVSHSVNVDGKIVTLQVWDRVGAERFIHFTWSPEYRGMDGIIIVYDVTDRDSFDVVHLWVYEARRYADPTAPLLLIGTKSDCTDTSVTEAEAAALAAELGMVSLRVSARTGENVNAAFSVLVRQCIAARAHTQPQLAGVVRTSVPAQLAGAVPSSAPTRSGKPWCAIA